MSETITFIRTYNYDVCLAPGKIWALSEAADYLAAHLAGKESWAEREDAYKGLLSIRDRLLTAMKKDIDDGHLAVNEVYLDGGADMGRHDMDVNKSTVQPFIFINWAVANDIEVPAEFAKYHARKQSNKSAFYEGLGLKRTTIHHERCRAVAELLWSMEPGIPISEMARRAEIVQYGCEGKEYDMRTVSRWLASLKADRRPGQRRKNKG
jgi:hypothetical protein